MKNVNIFFSYTIRDGLITKQLLEKLKIKLSILDLFNSYIDIVDNNSKFPQLYVLKQVVNSDILCIISTPSIYDSPWVRTEIKLAEKHSIPILKIKFEDICFLLKTDDLKVIYKSEIITSILNTINNKFSH